MLSAGFRVRAARTPSPCLPTEPTLLEHRRHLASRARRRPCREAKRSPARTRAEPHDIVEIRPSVARSLILLNDSTIVFVLANRLSTSSPNCPRGRTQHQTSGARFATDLGGVFRTGWSGDTATVKPKPESEVRVFASLAPSPCCPRITGGRPRPGAAGPAAKDPTERRLRRGPRPRARRPRGIQGRLVRVNVKDKSSLVEVSATLLVETSDYRDAKVRPADGPTAEISFSAASEPAAGADAARSHREYAERTSVRHMVVWFQVTSALAAPSPAAHPIDQCPKPVSTPAGVESAAALSAPESSCHPASPRRPFARRTAFGRTGPTLRPLCAKRFRSRHPGLGRPACRASFSALPREV